MGMLYNEPQMAEAYGIPEFFVTAVGRIECAGGGCVRSYGCAERGGILVPQYAAIIPVASLIDIAKFVHLRALEMYRRDLQGMLTAH